VARRAVVFKEAAAVSLLRIEAKFGVGFRSRLTAADNDGEQDGSGQDSWRSSQADIIRGAATAVHFPPMIEISPGDRVFILTGAGISAESGIPTFRGVGGLWRSYRFEEVASPHAWRRDPQLVWEFYSMRRRVAASAKPNPGHLALAELERALQDSLFLCTQNVDRLHEQAGLECVVHMHGELFKSRCDSCDRAPFEDAKTYEPPAEVPRCKCGGRIRPHICWFGERPYHMDEIFHALGECTVFIAIGTSGVVEPAASFVAHVRGRARTVYVGPEEPANRGAFTECIVGKSGEVLPGLFRCG
jgi:NAD-dependent deacetylase